MIVRFDVERSLRRGLGLLTTNDRFVHMEQSRAVRDKRALVLDALSQALR